MKELNMQELSTNLTDTLIHAFYGYECHIKGEAMPPMDKMRDLAYRKYRGTDYDNYDPKAVIECNVMKSIIDGVVGTVMATISDINKQRI